MATADAALFNGAKATRLDLDRAYERSALLDRLGGRSGEAVAERPARPPAFKCMLVGVTVAIVYVWPAQFLIYTYVGGYSSVLFNTLLALGFVVGTAAAWIITAFETRYWERNRHKLPEHADPPYWR
jgi:uncharacterized membrane protein YciS (DUF1049 family)